MSCAFVIFVIFVCFVVCFLGCRTMTNHKGVPLAVQVSIKWKTATKKCRAKVRELKGWFRTSLTTPAKEVWQTLNAKTHRHYQSLPTS